MWNFVYCQDSEAKADWGNDVTGCETAFQCYIARALQNFLHSKRK